jgi:hypothetical protein
MAEELLDVAVATAGGRELWSTLRGLKIDVSIGGPIWAMKGWPPGKTFDQTMTLDPPRPAHHPARRRPAPATGSHKRVRNRWRIRRRQTGDDP